MTRRRGQQGGAVFDSHMRGFSLESLGRATTRSRSSCAYPGSNGTANEPGSTGFEWVVNMKTAKALGITIPQSILLRPNRAIE